ncbi:MAG: S1C family serine protease [Mucilaginibacter sp.]
MNDGKLLEEIERYLNGEMNANERKQFEMLSNSDAAIAQKIAEHKEFLKILKQYSDRLALETRLNAIHDEIDVHTMADELIVHPSGIVRFWRNHHSKISVAASVAIFAVMFAMFITGNFNNHDAKYIQLARKVGSIESQTNQLKQKVAQTSTRPTYHFVDKLSATGFALTSNGLIATNYHVVRDNDSVYVQNAAGKLFKAEVVFVAPKTDIAIIKIVDTAFKGLGAIPYTFKKAESDLAETVYTYGFPQDSPTYGRGELTSYNGLNGDSTNYQVSIPLNPGNSGGPLMDSRGNVIGVVNAKETQLEGVNFAVKSSYLLSAIDSVSNEDTKVTLNTKNTMSNLSIPQQVKKLKNYVFMVKVDK